MASTAGTSLSKFHQALRQIDQLLTANSQQLSQQETEQGQAQLRFLESEHLRLLERIRELETALGDRSSPAATATATDASQHSAPVALATLPDLCLLALFKQLPLLDQLTVRQVSSKWSCLVVQLAQTRRALSIRVNSESENLSTVSFDFTDHCSDRMSNSWVTGLPAIKAILQNDDGSLMYRRRLLTPWNTLKLDCLSESVVQQIAATFTKIKELNVSLAKNSLGQSECVAHLLENLCSSLVTLQLYARTLKASVATADRIYAVINSTTSLKKLSIYLGKVPCRDLPIIASLEELNFSSFDTTGEEFVAMLLRHGESNLALRQIRYADLTHFASLQLFNQLSQRLRQCFRQLDLRPPLFADPTFSCDLFDTLTTFQIGLALRFTYRHLFSQLRKLPKLVHLSVLLRADAMLPDDEAHRPLPQLPSVKSLEVLPWLRSHQDLTPMALHWTLPNVQVITVQLNHGKCAHCAIDGFIDEYQPTVDQIQLMKQCVRQLFGPLKAQCKRLRAIVHDYENIIGTAEELLAK